MKLLLSSKDIKDIQASFNVLDEEKTGFIDLARFHILWIGLGFDANVSIDDLSIGIPEDRHQSITPNDVLTIISKLGNERKREDELACLFPLLSSNGKFLPRDLVNLAKNFGDPLSLEEADAAFGEKTFWCLDDLRKFLSV